MDSGIVFSGVSKSRFVDVLTWHDISTCRVWIHSRQVDQNSRRYISFEVQTFSKSLPRVSEEERRLRMKLAAMHEYQQGSEISATLMRNVSTGELLESHSSLLLSELLDKLGEKKIRLVSDIQSRAVDSNKKFYLDSAEEMGADGKDAILIAKLYCQQSESGGRNLAKQVAELLDVEPALVHTALRIARRNKWLTSLGAGKAGGVLTKLGERKFVEFEGPARMAHLLSAGRIYTN